MRWIGRSSASADVANEIATAVNYAAMITVIIAGGAIIALPGIGIGFTNQYVSIYLSEMVSPKLSSMLNIVF
ncbi:hypothetical protein IEQ34_021924 [Dendrobium chrysotoxum]|uniref:Uncharacterized protein n=1 Tax=Dendrobium chrysotoxum TaxID=161865 RepID=A0AAV7FJY5_DENCH|nr:hypothetical protein IEQ34_021924 [Dendrobium chrysotoxum]